MHREIHFALKMLVGIMYFISSRSRYTSRIWTIQDK